MRRKSQTEIMGLVMIVALISLALLLVIRFVVLRQPESARASYENKELSSNTISALLATEVKCTDYYYTIGDLLVDCAENKATDGAIDCDGKLSCKKVENILIDKVSDPPTGIFDVTLSQWKKYHFSVYTKDLTSVIKIPDENPCTGEKESTSFFLPVHSGIDMLFINLNICDKT